ncbi:uncharacterized protein HMPREF1541_07203 [Cyphellophora europaea CBS 101466]|uniref:NADH dehydrogenase [ubiquinone] 1 alpha subcomplex assembly factor 3 n=1 Tax=Cyphellophora europaea (strain CBS 101466) TaxID=1220924 RepID=W2RM39_CYPE1|nr:uncharacterized protein HMPREF1541_07203 [Cyphellophora europaea CBS 101466]ETN37581.1 hypothetical protein HMPREF1541_07203 [Cyphellophora europaea CBS 101466]
MPPHAPSATALRALRSLAFPQRPSTTTTTTTKCLSAISTPKTFSSPPTLHPHNRPISTTPHLPSQNQQTSTKYQPRRRTPQDRNPNAPSPTRDRGPTSSEDTQTDFSAMDIFNTSQTPQPANAVDACTPEGFHLSNGLKTTSGSGLLLLGGEAFSWEPWNATTTGTGQSAETRTGTGTKGVTGGAAAAAAAAAAGGGNGNGSMRDKRGMLVLPPEALSLLAHLYPRPDLLVLGTGDKLHPLHPSTRDYLMSELGMRVDVMDTANASAAYNLLATERGLEAGGVGAALFPISWRG